MENYYQESGRAGRDGNHAECILFYRIADMSRITSMVFTEHTGLENAYQMIDFAIDGINCRRDLISKHFSDVWSSKSKCNKMCDRCYHKDSINPPRMNIAEHCIELYKIIEHAENLEVKLTMLKLIDSWYQKGKPNLRVKDIPVPSFERFYAEQMLAHLIIKGYLREDFHFSAYTTISYIKKGKRDAIVSDRIFFHCARVLTLPQLEKTNKKSKSKSTLNGDECVITDSEAPPAKKIKKEKSRSIDRNSSSDKDFNESTISSKSESTTKKKKKTKHDKKHQFEPNSSQNDKADDCVMLIEGSDVIEID